MIWTDVKYDLINHKHEREFTCISWQPREPIKACPAIFTRAALEPVQARKAGQTGLTTRAFGTLLNQSHNKDTTYWSVLQWSCITYQCLVIILIMIKMDCIYSKITHFENFFLKIFHLYMYVFILILSLINLMLIMIFLILMHFENIVPLQTCSFKYLLF